MEQEVDLMEILNEGSPKDIINYFKKEIQFDNKNLDEILEF